MRLGFTIEGVSFPFELRKEYLAGQWGEQRCAEIMRRFGLYVVDLCDSKLKPGDAPIARSDRGGLVLPDFLLFKDGAESYFELKTKRSATWTAMTGRYEHGFGLRSFNHYREISRETGRRVLVGFLETRTMTLLVGDLQQLRKRARFYYGDKMDEGGMVFFPRDDLLQVWPEPTQRQEPPRQEQGALPW